MAKNSKNKPSKNKPSKSKPSKKHRATRRDPLIARAKKTLKPTKARKSRPLALPEQHSVGRSPPPLAIGAAAAVLDRLWSVVMARRSADPAISHSARLLSRGTAKVAQKFGEEAVECLIEAVAGNRDAVVAESADVLYHLIVLWVASGIRPDEVWEELKRREGISGIAEKASRARNLPVAFGLETTKIP